MPLVGEMCRTERATLVQGDCLNVLRCLEDGEADALVTDPPSGTGFMQRKWDSFKSRDAFVDFLTLRLAECRRVCRPGAVGLVWALPRTSHWTALAVEEAGWYIEDVVCHLFGTGMPKHRSKLKPGHEQWVVCRNPGPLWLGVEECRIGTKSISAHGGGVNHNGRKYGGGTGIPAIEKGSNPHVGRWPANVLLSHLSLPVMTLKDHLPSDIKDVIRRYFDGYVQVRAMREGKGHTTSANSLRPAVLQPIVQVRIGTNKTNPGSGGDGLSPVREDVSSAESMVEGRKTEVLQSDVQEPLPENLDRSTISTLRQETYGHISGEDVTGTMGGRQKAARSQSSQLEGRANDKRRVRSSDDRCPSGGSKDDGQTDAAEGDIHCRASASKGNGPGTTTETEGSCSSQERNKERQPPRESGADGLGSALSEAPTVRKGVGCSTRRDRPLEVFACDVPEGWLCYFDSTGEDLGCVCQGTKKVKGSHDSGRPIVTTHIGWFSSRPGVGKVYADADGTETVENWTCHPDCPIRLLDEQAGSKGGGYGVRWASTRIYGGGKGFTQATGEAFGFGDSGGPSRFFANFPAEEDTSRMLYCSKASKKDRGEGNIHPTVKSTTLMSWLVKLACPDGGLVLDSFAGSGSTGVACLRTGRRFFGVESDRESCLTAARRLRAEEAVT